MSHNYDVFSESGSGEITLSTEQFEAAQRYRDYCHHHRLGWKRYKQAIALISFETWLKQTAPSLNIEKDRCTVNHPEYAGLLDAVCLLTIDQHQVCLLPSLSIDDPECQLPRAAVDIPNLAAQLYILVAVDEELEMAIIQGFLLYEQIQTLKSNFDSDSEWNYALPVSAFNSNTPELTLYLLTQTPAPLSQPTQILPSELAKIRSEVAEKLPLIKTNPLQHPWSWEQLVAILTTSDLRQQVSAKL